MTHTLAYTYNVFRLAIPRDLVDFSSVRCAARTPLSSRLSGYSFFTVIGRNGARRARVSFCCVIWDDTLTLRYFTRELIICLEVLCAFREMACNC